MQPDEFLCQLEGVRRSGEGWIARCPSHEDHRQSLSLGVGDDGRVLVNCHAGCSPDAVCAALGLKLADLFVDEKPGGNGNASTPARREIVATYDYVDESRQLLFQVVRFEPKDFRQRRPDGEGGWTWKVAGTRRVLYRLPEIILAARLGGTVYVVEGEKDVHALEAAGAIATTSPAGAGKWRPEYSEALTGAHVAIVADRDEPGRAHAEQVAKSLEGKAASVRILEAAAGKDAADHLAAGKRVDELQVPAWTLPAEQHDNSPFIDWTSFWEREHSDAEWTYDDVLARGRGHALWAKHKTGKSLLLLWIASQIVQRPDHAVLYLDYEMTESDLYDRLEDMGCGSGTDFSRFKYALLPSLPPLDTAEGGKALIELLGAAQEQAPECHFTVAIDTISRAVRGEENDADTYRAFYTHTGMLLKRLGVTWVRLDHAGHEDKHQRGSSGKGDDVDVIWHLTPTANGLELKRDAARMSWVPERVVFKRSNNPLHYIRMVQDWPEGTQETALHLDRLKADPKITVRAARRLLQDHGVGVSQAVTAAAVRWRKQREEGRCA